MRLCILFILTLSRIPLSSWKYGLLEVQAILVELLKSFEFLDSGKELLNGMALISLIPIVKGREQEGVQVPVLVQALSSDS